jgi:hypothetical protein
MGVWENRRVSGWMDGWVDEWIDDWAGKVIDKGMDELFYLCYCRN